MIVRPSLIGEDILCCLETVVLMIGVEHTPPGGYFSINLLALIPI